MLWRLPSLFDPPWINDEGTYFAVAQSLAHGLRLYTDVWENKPPGIYLLYSAIYHLAGASVPVARLVASAAVLCLVVLTLSIGRCFMSRSRALVAAMLVGLLMGVPFLEGTTANAETFLALLSSTAVYLAIGRDRGAFAGMAEAGAVLFKAVAGLDAAALGLWLLLNRRRSVIPYALTLSGSLGVALLVVWRAGILGDMVRDAFLYDIGYVHYGNGGGVPWLVAAKLVITGGCTVLLRRAPFPFLWLLYALAGALISGRIFGHYLVQAVVPFSLTLAMAGPLPRTVRMRPMALPGAFFAAAVLAAVAGASLSVTGHDSILARRLQYWPSFGLYALHLRSPSAYRAGIDDHVNRNLRIVDALHGLGRGDLLVWGNAPWIYVLSGRLPATPYTSALRQPEVPGETRALQHAILSRRPAVVVLIRPTLPPLGRAATALHTRYRAVRTIDGASIYVAARATALRLSSASITPSAISGTR